MIFKPPPTTSWVIRKLCKLKEQMSQWINSDKYNINIVYKELIRSNPRVNWCKFVRHRSSVPKSRFIFWMAMLNKLKTKDHLMRFGVTPDNCCPICCIDSESSSHLYFSCGFSSRCANLMTSWLGITPITSLQALIPSKWMVSRFMKKIIIASICNLIYRIWRVRNYYIWYERVISPSLSVNNVKLDIKLRMLSLYPKSPHMSSTWSKRLLEV